MRTLILLDKLADSHFLHGDELAIFGGKNWISWIARRRWKELHFLGNKSGWQLSLRLLLLRTLLSWSVREGAREWTLHSIWPHVTPMIDLLHRSLTLVTLGRHQIKPPLWCLDWQKLIWIRHLMSTFFSIYINFIITNWNLTLIYYLSWVSQNHSLKLFIVAYLFIVWRLLYLIRLLTKAD